MIGNAPPILSPAALAVFLAFLAGCSTPRIEKVEREAQVDPGTLERPVPRNEETFELSDDLEALIQTSKKMARTGFQFLPGDRIEITVFGHPELTMQIRLPRNVQVRFPLIGEVAFAGKTIRSVEEEIRTRLEADHLFEAQVSVLPLEFAERKVYIMGNVKKPGAFSIPPFGTLSLIQLISLAGGFDEDADRKAILLVREEESGKRTTYRISFLAIEQLGNMDLDVYLEPGDRVHVPQQKRVFVLGSVNHPGAFPIGAERLTASKAVALAQGFTRLAAPNSTVVIREGKTGKKVTFRVPLSSILELGNEELDLELKPGDVVFVPESLF